MLVACGDNEASTQTFTLVKGESVQFDVPSKTPKFIEFDF